MDIAEDRKPFDVSTLGEIEKTLPESIQALISNGSRDSSTPLLRRPLNAGDSSNPTTGTLDNSALEEPARPEDEEKAKPTVEEILKERAGTHGAFADNARVSQSLKRIAHGEVGWDRLSDVQREALHMIMHKIARIISGDSNVHDHWDDIAGYAKLASADIK